MSRVVSIKEEKRSWGSRMRQPFFFFFFFLLAAQCMLLTAFFNSPTFLEVELSGSGRLNLAK